MREHDLKIANSLWCWWTLEKFGRVYSSTRLRPKRMDDCQTRSLSCGRFFQRIRFLESTWSTLSRRPWWFRGPRGADEAGGKSRFRCIRAGLCTSCTNHPSRTWCDVFHSLDLADYRKVPLSRDKKLPSSSSSRSSTRGKHNAQPTLRLWSRKCWWATHKRNLQTFWYFLNFLDRSHWAPN